MVWIKWGLLDYFYIEIRRYFYSVLPKVTIFAPEII